MTPDQIRALAAAGESASLEFKKSTAVKDRACRTLCAFANGQGGHALFGVMPAGKVVGQAASIPAKVTGTTTGKTTGRTTGRTTAKAHEAVSSLLAAEPSLSIPEVAKRIGKGPRATERIVLALREAGKLERVGPAKGGHWQVIE